MEGEVRMYTCGPTLYDHAHIGNHRTFLFEDVLRRYLKYKGFKVTQVMNLTDVDDKTIRGCNESGQSLTDYTNKFKMIFFEDLKTLNMEEAEHYPAATDYITEMVDLIKKLEEKGHTYQLDRSVYYRISSFDRYGRLANIRPEDLVDGASGRVDTDEYEKENPRDFVLWKAWKPEDGDVYWETELGKGRPGWHVECSAMSMKFLGESFDIHTGAHDNIFPHHENEIAQSEAATGSPFVKYWLHSAWLLIDRKKMAKSLKNMWTLRDLLVQGLNPMSIRYALISTHYRQPLNFSPELVEQSDAALARLRDFISRLDREKAEGTDDLADLITAAREGFEKAMDDDLNMSGALGAVFDFVRDVNRRLDSDAAGPEGVASALETMRGFDRVMGVLEQKQKGIDSGMMRLIDEREVARMERDFSRADSLRDQIIEKGYTIKDSPQGPIVEKTP